MYVPQASNIIVSNITKPHAVRNFWIRMVYHVIVVIINLSWMDLVSRFNAYLVIITEIYNNLFVHVDKMIDNNNVKITDFSNWNFYVHLISRNVNFLIPMVKNVKQSRIVKDFSVEYHQIHVVTRFHNDFVHYRRVKIVVRIQPIHTNTVLVNIYCWVINVVKFEDNVLFNLVHQVKNIDDYVNHHIAVLIKVVLVNVNVDVVILFNHSLVLIIFTVTLCHIQMIISRHKPESRTVIIFICIKFYIYMSPTLQKIVE